MKIYEKPMAIVNKFEVEDVIANSMATMANAEDLAKIQETYAEATQGVVFEW